MSRRRSSQPDSLELLLDTICNTFGGVLFIAILVVLLLQQTGVGPAATVPAAKPVSPLELQAITERMETVTADLARLRQNRDSQDAIIETFAPVEIRQLLAKRVAVTLQQEALQSSVDQLVASNTCLVTQIESLDEENQTLKTSVADAKQKHESVTKQLEQERQSRIEEVRLPVVRHIFGKVEIGLILRYKRLYVWHEYHGGVRVGLNTKDFVVTGEELGGLVTHPNPTRGVPLDETKSSQDAVRKILKHFNPKDCYFCVTARPDSYGEFRHLRDRAIELGFEYRLMPVDTEERIYDRGGLGGNVQ